MKRFALLVILPLSVLTACSNPHVANGGWFSKKKIDEFTDKSTCSISIGSFYTRSSVYTYSYSYYPFIDVIDNEVRVGVKSEGRFKLAVGDVQFRIDNNEAWTISSSETPITHTNSNSQASAIQNEAYNRVMQIMSPFTVATGDKALKIIDQMRNGSVLKYRIIGANQPGSTTGEYKLDQSFITALKQCGIS